MFTPSDWNLPRKITVTGAGAGTTKIVAVYAGGDYDFRDATLNIPVTVPPENAFVVPRTYLDLTAGETRRFSVRLARKPQARVIGTWRLVSTLDVWKPVLGRCTAAWCCCGKGKTSS